MNETSKTREYKRTLSTKWLHLQAFITCQKCRYDFFAFTQRHNILFAFSIYEICNFGLQIEVKEAKKILENYSNPDKMVKDGITVAGVKYMYLSSSERVVRAKTGMSGVHIIKTTQGKHLVLMGLRVCT